MKLLSVESVELDGAEEEEEEPESPPEVQTNLGLILGLSIPLLLIVASLVMIVKTNKAKELS